LCSRAFSPNALSQTRRFPPPWSVEEQVACFVVRDRDGQQLAYVYFEDEPGRRSARYNTRRTVRGKPPLTLIQN